MAMEASTNLLINQWQDSPKFRGIVEGGIDVVERDVMETFKYLEDMLNVDTAKGAWLDLIGQRVGIERPNIIGRSSDKKFGFKGVTRSGSFDNEEYKGYLANQTYIPLSDGKFRKIIKARGRAIHSKGDFTSFVDAVKQLDESAVCIDNRNMNVTVNTTDRALLELADSLGAIPRPVGVSMNLKEGYRFGFEGSGEGFDRVRYE